MNEKTLPLMLQRTVRECPDLPAQYHKNKQKEFVPVTYSELYEKALNFAGGLLKLGCKRGDKIGLISDNRPEWLYVSFGIVFIGAADVPRGCDATEKDLIHILSFAECEVVVVENESQVNKVLKSIDHFSHLKKLIVIEDFDFSHIKNSKIELHSFAELSEAGKNARDNKEVDVEAEIQKADNDDIVTVIFTSGTTGTPKGVMLSHGNFLAQLDLLAKTLRLKRGFRSFSVLPVWHSFERTCEYILLNLGASIVYSKPIASVLLPDIEKIQPHAFPSVPRVWEGIYDAIMKMMKKKGGATYAIFKASLAVGQTWKRNQLKLSGRMPCFKPSDRILIPLSGLLPTILLYPLYKLGDVLVFKKIKQKMGPNFDSTGGVSGGGALPHNVDMFFSTVGIELLEGYGITEMSPVVSVRSKDKAIAGTVGKPLANLKAKVVKDSGEIAKVGEVGTIMFKGPSVMKGYYKNPEKTAETIDADGWLDTGDLGCLTLDGDIIITGRKKDTIVLRGGENLEPVPIEMKLQESEYIKTAVLLGQDQRYLAALVLIDEVSLKMWAEKNNMTGLSIEQLVETNEVKKLYDSEITDLISAQNGFKIFERINKFKLLTTPFEQGRELSAKGDVMRHKINELYQKEMNELFPNK